MSVHHTELSRKFFEHYFQLATKVETIDPFYTDDVTCVFDFTQINGERKSTHTKNELLEVMSSLVPLHPSTNNSFVEQPYKDSEAIITAKAYSTKQNEKQFYSMTFVLKEVETETHRYGITHQIVNAN